MPANTNPIFVLSSNIGKTIVNAANVATDGSGTIGTNIFLLLTAGSNGSRIDSITFTNSSASAINTSSNTRVACYISTQTSGATSSANTFIFAEGLIPVRTARSATNIGSTITFNFAGGLLIPSGTNILVTSSIYSAVAPLSDIYSVVAKGGNY